MHDSLNVCPDEGLRNAIVLFHTPRRSLTTRLFRIACSPDASVYHVTRPTKADAQPPFAIISQCISWFHRMARQAPDKPFFVGDDISFMWVGAKQVRGFVQPETREAKAISVEDK